MRTLPRSYGFTDCDSAALQLVSSMLACGLTDCASAAGEARGTSERQNRTDLARRRRSTASHHHGGAVTPHQMTGRLPIRSRVERRPVITMRVFGRSRLLINSVIPVPYLTSTAIFLNDWLCRSSAFKRVVAMAFADWLSPFPLAFNCRCKPFC